MADLVVVMERKHKQLLKQHYPFATDKKRVIVLDIEDNYGFGDEELIAIMNKALEDYL